MKYKPTSTWDNWIICFTTHDGLCIWSDDSYTSSVPNVKGNGSNTRIYLWYVAQVSN